MTPEQEQMLKEVHAGMKAFRQWLSGFNHTPGFADEWESYKKQDRAFRKEFYQFRLTVIVALVLLVGGSGFGAAKILALLGG